MRESRIETEVCRWARGIGILPIKLTSFGSAGWPDHLFLSLFRTRVAFIEFKSAGKKAGLRQELRMEELHKRGFPVMVVDNVNDGINFLVSSLLSEDGGETWNLTGMRWVPYEPRDGENYHYLRDLPNLKK